MTLRQALNHIIALYGEKSSMSRIRAGTSLAGRDSMTRL